MQHRYSIGELVRVIDFRHTSLPRPIGSYYIMPDMPEHIGNVFTITSHYEGKCRSLSEFVRLTPVDSDERIKWWWHPDLLEPVENDLLLDEITEADFEAIITGGTSYADT